MPLLIIYVIARSEATWQSPSNYSTAAKKAGDRTRLPFLFAKMYSGDGFEPAFGSNKRD